MHALPIPNIPQRLLTKCFITDIRHTRSVSTTACQFDPATLWNVYKCLVALIYNVYALHGPPFAGSVTLVVRAARAAPPRQ